MKSPRRPNAATLAWSVVTSGALLAALAWPAGAAAQAARAAPALPAAAASTRGAPTATVAYDGVVEALRQTTVAAQVSAAVVEIRVKAGDRVSAGQVLMRLDARAAEQNNAASDAQVRAARAAQDVAAKEYARQQQLAAEKFISGAALDRAEAEFKAAQAQAAALLAQAGAMRTASGFYVVRAPYAGVVSEVPVTLGDMALPGRPLLTLYDPAALRVTASVPQSAAGVLAQAPTAQALASVRVELPGSAGAAREPKLQRVQVLPSADVATHTVTVRADLATGLADVMPGQFARLWLPAPEGAARAASPWVPLSAVVRRGEMTGLYVLDAQERALLRQVRLGRSDGQRVEILSGLAEGERVASDAQVATRASSAAVAK